ncbi:helix-turn-helix domain-containing protein [Promicromonospora sp. CA-289599]|uniref:helix-turn-helix domain-containing protein n=1 Tax=Promicromonospora sp. CA-289599 TaxID=3240014 RepID=UPI003D946862
MNDEEAIGRRIAHFRKARGMTQVALAQQASISLSLLRKVEQESREATPVLIAAVAKPLAIAHLRQADRNAQALARVPALLLETTAAIHTMSTAAEREQLFDAVATVLHPTMSILHATGYDDLATIVADRIAWTAAQWGNPLAVGLAAHTRTSSMLRHGTYDVGLRLIDSARAVLDSAPTRDDTTLRMIGSLHLRAADLSARAGSAAGASAHISEARDIAEYLRVETDHLWRNLAFGPTNTAFHDVATAIELGDGPRALTLARDLRIPDGFPPTRTGHHFMDIARAYLWQGRHEQALASLQRARELAPQQTRHHPTTREVVRMLVRAHRHTNKPLARFNAWIGAGG